ncbi:MAG: archease [SAR324 cluster bacterium]
MAYEFLEHTADVRMRVTGTSLERLFSDALAGLMDLLRPGSPTGPALRRPVSLSAGDATALLVDFLSDALLGALTRRERYDGLVVLELTEERIEAELVGAPVAGFADDVKAVTYHEAELRRRPDGLWETVIVFDV